MSGADPDQDREHRKRIASGARDFLVHLDALGRQLRTHDPSNATPQQTLAMLAADVRALQQEDGELALVFAEGHAFVNGIWLRASKRAWEAAKMLTEQLGGVGGRGLVLSEGLPASTLLNLCQLLRRSGAEGGPGKQGFDAANLPGVSLLPLPSGADQARSGRQQAREDAVDVFREGMMTLGRDQVGKLDLFMRRRQRALVQKLVKLAEDSPEDLLGLTTIRSPTLPSAAHSLAVAIYSISIGRMMDLSRRDLLRLGIAAMNHNLGEALVPEDVFSPERKLMMHERRTVERHPLLGLRHLVRHYGFGPGVVERALVSAEHHIDYDNEGGYPFPAPMNTHVFSRLISVSDVFDALCSDRPQRLAFPPDQAIKLVGRQGGRQLDPVLVRLLVRTVGRYPPGSLVELDTGEWGVVIGPGKGADPLQRPRVLLISDEDGFEMDELMAVDLGERHPRRRAWLRTITRTRDPRQLGLKVAKFLYAERIELVPVLLDNDQSSGRARPLS